MKKQIYLFLIGLAMTVFWGGCTQSMDEETVVLRIANWEEYIDEGGWDDDELIDLEDGTEILGDENMLDLFEEWYEESYGEKVKIEYSTFGTNEDLYNQLTLGDTFDLVCPSEYMIMKLMTEKKLQPFSEQFYDTDLEENYYARGVSPYIFDVFENLEIGGECLTKYGAGYMWGSMGIVYNPEVVSEEETRHWSMLLDKKYRKQITMKDSVREAYIVAQAIRKEELFLQQDFVGAEDYTERLFEEINETSEEAVEDVEDILSRMRENAYSLETDNGKADLVTGKVVANMQWSGDGVYTLDQAEEDGIELSFAVPEEASNLWFDGWCMLKKGIGEDERKQRAAEAFVNYVSRPDNVIKNMYYVGYTSVIAGGDSDLIYQYADWCYGADDGDEETVPYSLRYFFTSEEEDASDEYVLSVPVGEEDRQVFAQYPTRDVIRRSAVMRCFDNEQNKRISTMWTNIRCFRWGDLFG
ncbi:MAG: extracellular solute-binding protein [Lachnospiraceae bacterium]|nr:extracellular solute-binding protein [Lachnospiraceae bacterium]